MSVSGDPDKPFAAGNLITATCVSGGGKPQPLFRWSVGGQDVTDHTETEADNLEVSSEISFEITEEHDGQSIECWYKLSKIRSA